MSHLERRTGPFARSASQIFCRRRERHAPNFTEDGAEDTSVDALTRGVGGRSGNLCICWGGRRQSPPGGGAVQFQMRRLCLFFCGKLESLDIRKWVPKILKASSDFRKRLNLRETRSKSSPPKKLVASVVQVGTCGPWRIAARMVSKEQDSPTEAGKPWNAKVDKRSVAGCWDGGGGGDIVGDWNGLMKSFKSGTYASVVQMTDAQCATGSREVGTMEHW